VRPPPTRFPSIFKFCLQPFSNSDLDHCYPLSHYEVSCNIELGFYDEAPMYVDITVFLIIHLYCCSPVKKLLCVTIRWANYKFPGFVDISPQFFIPFTNGNNCQPFLEPRVHICKLRFNDKFAKIVSKAIFIADLLRPWCQPGNPVFNGDMLLHIFVTVPSGLQFRE
jgi:hypothetical protein